MIDDDEQVRSERRAKLSPPRNGDGLSRCRYDERALAVPGEKCATPHQPRMLHDRFIFEPDNSQALLLDGRRLRVRGRRDRRDGITRDHKAGNDVFLVHRARAQWVCRVDCVPRSGDPPFEALENPHLRGVARDEMKRMDRSALSDAIHASCTLLEPHRVPRQLQVDDHPAVMMKIEPFSCRVRGQKDRVPSACKLLERQSPFAAGETAVKHRTGKRQTAPQVQERVAILGEDDPPFTPPEQAREQTGNRPQLRFASRRDRAALAMASRSRRSRAAS